MVEERVMDNEFSSKLETWDELKRSDAVCSIRHHPKLVVSDKDRKVDLDDRLKSEFSYDPYAKKLKTIGDHEFMLD